MRDIHSLSTNLLAWNTYELLIILCKSCNYNSLQL